MKRLLPLVLLSVLAMPAFADKVSKAEEAEFRAMVEKLASGWATLNPDNAAAFYAKDGDLVFYDLAPLRYTGWTQYDKGVREQFSPMETLKLTVGDDLKVSKQGKMAWTTSTIHATVKMKDQPAPMEMDARQTLIWEKRDGKWLIIHEHISAPLPPMAEPTKQG